MDVSRAGEGQLEVTAVCPTPCDAAAGYHCCRTCCELLRAVDVSRAGEGQLEITVDHGSVPNTVRPVDKGQFVVTFTPREARPHVVQITFNGEQCKCALASSCFSKLHLLVQVLRSVAEWLANAGLGRRRAWVQIAAATLSGNSLRQTVHTRRASAKMVAALLRVAGVTADLAESNGNLPPGL